MTEKKEIAVEVSGLSKFYGDVRAVDGINLKIHTGEYFALLGPSGGGKTTLLRLIGGFIRPTVGQIFIHNEDVSDLPPNLRPTSMVFQSFALFPHMTVMQNVSYGLRLKKMPTDEITDRVQNMLEIAGLAGFGNRMPHELSGGQQQRVQLARSLVLETEILLLDEPLAALDAKLRKDMCIELKRLQEKVGITFVHVTHNQEEAMTVADNLAIISGGQLIESGSSVNLYNNPKRRFTAEFIGENNIFDGRVTSVEGEVVVVDLGYGIISVQNSGQKISIGDEVSVSVRSELIRAIDGQNYQMLGFETLDAIHRETVYLGLTISEILSLPNGDEIMIRRISDGALSSNLSINSKIKIGWRQKDGRLHID